MKLAGSGSLARVPFLEQEWIPDDWKRVFVPRSLFSSHQESALVHRKLDI